MKTIQQLKNENKKLKKILSNHKIPICNICDEVISPKEERIQIIHKTHSYGKTKLIDQIHTKCYTEQNITEKTKKEIQKAMM